MATNSVIFIVLGVVLAILSYACGALGIGIQRLSHIREDTKPESQRRKYVACPLWWLGLCLSLSGSGLSLAALALAPGTVVTALSGLSIIFATIVARVLPTNEPRYTPWMAIALIVVGSAIGVVGPTTTEVINADTIGDLLWRPSIVIFVCAQLLAVIICSVTGSIIVHRARKSQARLDAARPPPSPAVELAGEALAAEASTAGDTPTPLCRTTAEPGVTRTEQTVSTAVSALAPPASPRLAAHFSLGDWLPRPAAAAVRAALCISGALMGGICLAVSKGWSSIVGAGDFGSWWGLGLSVGVVATMVTQIVLQNAALAVTNTAEYYAIFHTTWKLSSLVTNGLAYNEFVQMVAWEWAMFVCGNLLAIVGVIVAQIMRAKHEKASRKVKNVLTSPNDGSKIVQSDEPVAATASAVTAK